MTCVKYRGPAHWDYDDNNIVYRFRALWRPTLLETGRYLTGVKDGHWKQMDQTTIGRVWQTLDGWAGEALDGEITYDVGIRATREQAVNAVRTYHYVLTHQ